MKTTKETKRLWVHHRQDGCTAIAEYTNNKRCNIIVMKDINDVVAIDYLRYLIALYAHHTKRMVEFVEDPLPPEFFARLASPFVVNPSIPMDGRETNPNHETDKPIDGGMTKE